MKVFWTLALNIATIVGFGLNAESLSEYWPSLSFLTLHLEVPVWLILVLLIMPGGVIGMAMRVAINDTLLKRAEDKYNLLAVQNESGTKELKNGGRNLGSENRKIAANARPHA